MSPAPRRFDHEEATRRYQAGESCTELAAAFGVTYNAIWHAVTEGGAACNRRSKAAYYDRHRVPCEGCGEPCLDLGVPGKARHNPDGRALCRRCRADERIERLRFDENAEIVAVRCSMVDCANGERWQPLENFPRGSRLRSIVEGGIHGQCRACQTRARQAYRLARRVPCSGCGTLVNHEHPRGEKPPECQSCANRRIRRERRRDGQHATQTH